jgi:broad-specificity NMP kinase
MGLTTGIRPAGLCISGRIGSGKTTFSKALADGLNWDLVGLGDYIRWMAKTQGLTQTREELQQVGYQLVSSDCKSFCEGALAFSGWKVGHGVIVDGLRHKQVFGTMCDLLSPLRVYLIFVDISESELIGRIATRGITSLRELSRIERSPAEGEVCSDLKSVANMHVHGTTDVEELVRGTKTWLANVQATQ